MSHGKVISVARAWNRKHSVGGPLQDEYNAVREHQLANSKEQIREAIHA